MREKIDKGLNSYYCWVCFYLMLTSAINSLGNEIIHGQDTLVCVQYHISLSLLFPMEDSWLNFSVLRPIAPTPKLAGRCQKLKYIFYVVSDKNFVAMPGSLNHKSRWSKGIMYGSDWEYLLVSDYICRVV